MLWLLQGWGQLDPVNTKQSEGKPQFQTGPTLTLLFLNCNRLTLFENIEPCCWDSTLLKQTQRCWLQEQPPSCLHVDLFGSLGFWFKAGAPRHIHILMKALPACSLAMLAAALKTDWQPLCGSSDAAGDLMNERKRWRDLCLMPQRYLLSPLCTSGQNARPLTLKCKASDLPVCSNDIWYLKSGLKSNLICDASIIMRMMSWKAGGVGWLPSCAYLFPCILPLATATFSFEIWYTKSEPGVSVHVLSRLKQNL